MTNRTYVNHGIEYTRPHQPFDPEHPGKFPIFVTDHPDSGIGHFESGSYKAWDNEHQLGQIMTGVTSEQAAAEQAEKEARWNQALAEPALQAAEVEKPMPHSSEPQQPSAPEGQQ